MENSVENFQSEVRPTLRRKSRKCIAYESSRENFDRSRSVRNILV